MNSWRHRPTGVRCPFCTSTWGTATGLVHHLERGCCPSAPLDRDKLYIVIRQHDPQGRISKRLLQWEGTRTYEATAKAWNPDAQAYECYLCHKWYNTLVVLNKHLSSPRHQQAFYHCPNLSCRKEFKTLAAMINHLESESCSYMRFRVVQSRVQEVINPGRAIML